MIDEGLLEDIDAHELDAYDRVDPRWRGQWWDPTNDYSIPADFGTAGFAVNRDVYQGPVDSWSVYFEPPAELQGKIASLSSPDEVIGAAQLYLGVEFCTEDADEMKKVLDLLVAHKPHVAVYTSDNIDNRSAAVMSARISGGTASKLRSGRVKMFLDGVIDTWTAYMVGDYADRPGYGGAPLFEPEAFKAICTAIDREGLQISVHAVGDGVVRLALDGYAAARRADGARDSRHRIEHIDTIHPEDVPRLAELVVASMQPVHVPGSACRWNRRHR